MRFFGYTLGDENNLPMPAPTPEMMEEMGRFVQEARDAGILVETGGMAPVATGTRVSLVDGVFTVHDGPFTETKELVGGWALMECKDKDEAIYWTKRFLTVAGGGYTTIREVW